METSECYYLAYNACQELYYICAQRGEAERLGEGSEILVFYEGRPGFDDCRKICKDGLSGRNGVVTSRGGEQKVPRKNLTPEELARQKFEAGSALQAEFGAFETYWAFVRASDSGLARISTGPGVVV